MIKVTHRKIFKECLARPRSGVFIVNLEYISHLFSSVLLTLNKLMLAGFFGFKSVLSHNTYETLLCVQFAEHSPGFFKLFWTV